MNEETEIQDKPEPGRDRSRRRLTRSRDDRYIGGVAAGLASYFNVDPTLVRVAFAVSLAIGGVGVVAYLALLALMPLEGNPDEPAPPVTGNRRTLAIGAAVLVGVMLLIASATGGSGTSWLFGFGPGVLFGILLWTAVAAGLFWAAAKARVTGPDGPARAEEPGSTTAGAEPGFAEAPTQISPAAAAWSDPRPGQTDDSPSETASTTGRSGSQEETAVLGETPPPAAGSSRPSTFGKVMTWLAIAFAGLVILTILAAISFAVTALFGAIPAAIVVIGCGIAVVSLALSDRPQMALWTTAAAIFIAVPMAVVSIASLEIQGDWGELNENPVSAFEIPADGYQMAAGALKVDLRDFPFKKGKTVTVETDSGFGATGVIVPDDVCVVGNVEGRIGHMEVLGSRSSGIDIDRNLGQARPGVPVLELDSDFKIGYFGVFDNTGWKGKGGEWPDDLSDFDREAAVQRARQACSAPAAATGKESTEKASADKAGAGEGVSGKQ